MRPASYEQAATWLDEHCTPVRPEEVAVRDSAGRVLASSIEAPGDLPTAPLAATDGFALDAGATLGASDYNPLPLTIDGATGKVDARTACPVVSGQAMPGGADTVIPLDETTLRGDELEVHAPLASGSNVVPAGREVRAGETLMEAGRLLRPVDAAMLAALNRPSVDVVGRPRIGILVVRERDPDISGALVETLVRRDGGVGERATVSGAGALAAALSGREDDLLLVIGGTGLGANDTVAAALEEAGELSLRGVAINPGETTTLGVAAGMPIIALPGAPLGAFVAYDLVAGGAVRRLAGRGPALPYGTCRAVLERKIASGLGRLECCRVRLSEDRAEPIAVADSRTLSTAVRADGFVLVPAHSEGFAAGADVLVYLYEQRY